MKIRPMNLSDASAWREIRVKMLTDHPREFGADADQFAGQSMQEVEEFVGRNLGPKSVMFGAFDAEQDLVGTIGYYCQPHPKRVHRREIWGMYVAPVARRQGVGMALVERVLEDLRRQPGVVRIYLEVSASNTGARALYEATGFEVYGVEPEGLKIGDHLEDTVYMTQRL